ncbi:uncharacterized protein [Asterias amurensis]|uniref:uncharacterized protein n=1 Tax=Asterias amurensis TaxID=7602 RepID=UPI003AB2028F
MESDIIPPEPVPGKIGVWSNHQSDTVTKINPSIRLPDISVGGTMAAANSSKPSAEQSIRLSPRPGRKLRLAPGDEGERLRSTSPHSPRKPRTSKSPSRDILGYISDSPPRSPRRMKYKSPSLEDESHVIKGTFASSYSPQPRTKNSTPVSIPKNLSSDDSPNTVRLRVKPGDLRSRSMTRLGASSPMNSPTPRRPPRLGKTISWSTDSEEDSPRSTKPLSLISLSPKRDTPLSSRNGLFETNDKNHDEVKQLSEVFLSSGGKSSQQSPKTSLRSILRKSASFEQEDSPQPEPVKTERKSHKKHSSSPRTYNLMLKKQASLSGASEPDEEDVTDALLTSFSLPERAPLPDTSSIFQQALTNLNSRKPSESSDPGDLHVRRSSLITSFINLTVDRPSNSPTTPPSSGIDCLFDVMSENDTDKEPRLSNSVRLKVSNWTGKSRKKSAPSKMVTVDQIPQSSSPLTPSPPRRRRVVSEVAPPRRDLLEGVDNPRPKKSTDSMSESSEGTSSSSQNNVAQISRPLISKTAMKYIMNFISKATVSDVAPAISTKSTAHQHGRESAMFPEINNSGSARRARSRRDSLRAIQYFISGENTVGDTTEITSFDDLRNCRYIRDFKPTGNEVKNGKRTAYHECLIVEILHKNMATPNIPKPSAEPSARLTPQSGRIKLRLATDEGERLRSTSPHSPRKPRTSKPLSRGISVESISSSPLSSPRDLNHSKSSPSIGDDEPPLNSPVTTPQFVLSDNSPKRAWPLEKPSALRSRSTSDDASSPLTSPRPPQPPKTVRWSTDSEEESPRSKPLPPIFPSPKKDGSICAWDALSENKSDASDTDDDEIESFPPTFPLPERAQLPDTSSIFQQALTNLRKPSLCDPGDLHVRRSSLITNYMNLGRKSTTTTPPSGLDCLFDAMPEVSENDNRSKQTMLSDYVLSILSKRTGKSRKISAPPKLQPRSSSPLTPTPPIRRRVVSEVTPPRRDLLEGVDNPRRPKTSVGSMSVSSEVTSSSSINVTEIARPYMSMKSMSYIMNFMSNATVSEAVPGRGLKPTRKPPPRMKTVLPAIPNSVSARRARNRRDSLRAIQQIVNEQNPLGDTTEITNFEDLRNCRYIRDFKPTGKEAGASKRTLYHEW